MISWSIDAALGASVFDRVLVSTDDEEVADIARSCGADVPFRRPKDISEDWTPTAPVVQHAIRWCAEAGLEPSQVCCLYATAPFTLSTDLSAALRSLEDGEADFVFSVASFAAPIQRALRITDAGRVQMLDARQHETRSQDLEPAFHDAGQFYWGSTAAWLSEHSIFDGFASPYKLPRHRVQDIDTVEDWERAEWLFRAMALRESGR